ncbi:MAG: histidine kinase [Aquincola sp.]|nr:histidine kinase [Aquincola sp.]MDH4288157.1 histidine kinase [Aquincola sp.]
MRLPDTAPAQLSTLSPASTLGPLPSAHAAVASDGAAFDICHGALALRALVAVNGVVLLGTLVGAASAFEALSAMGPALMVALPATLLWLGLTCSLRRQIVRARPVWRVLALTSLGAMLAWLASVPVVALGLMEFQPLRAVSLPLVGAAFALPLTLWLQSRERRRMPADASARLAELQSRIRPHFLFNTLNTAIALVRSDPARAENVLEDLAELFRVALEQDGSARGSSSVTLADEIELARRYLAIESLRFGERLQLQWQLDPAADAARLPPLVLQPLLENAVRHGIEPAEGGGAVRVRTRAHLGRAEIVIDNTLPGQATPNPGHGLALANVRERLRLLHDLDAQFDAAPKGERFRVRIVVPIGEGV